MRTRFTSVAFFVTALTLAVSVRAGVIEAYRAEWAELRPQLNANIERYRKGDAAIELVDVSGKAVTNAVPDIRQKGD